MKHLLMITSAIALAAGSAHAMKESVSDSDMKMFKMVDTSNDGLVSRAEYDAFTKSMLMQADADNSGGISLVEMRQYKHNMHKGENMTAVQVAQMEPQIKYWFDEKDADDDATITKAELMTYTTAMFRGADTNVDGFISDAEFAEFNKTEKAKMKNQIMINSDTTENDKDQIPVNRGYVK